MNEVFWEAVRPLNLPFTVLLAAVVCYWLIVALGMISIDLHGETDFDGHGGESDGDAGEHAGHPEAGWFSQILHFVNVGEVPVTIIGSILALWMWLFSMLANHYWTGDSLARAALALIPNLLASAVLTRFLTLPFKPLLRALNREGEEHQPIIGEDLLTVNSHRSKIE